MEAQSDYVEYCTFFQLQQAEPFIQLLETFQNSHRLTGMRSEPEKGVLTGVILHEQSLLPEAGEIPLGRLAANLQVVQNLIRLSGLREESIIQIADEMKRKLGSAVSVPTHESGVCVFSDVAVEALLFPTQEAELSHIAKRLNAHATDFFEEIWSKRPLRTLGNMSPVQAAADSKQQKRLHGVVKFIEECFIASSPRVAQGETISIAVLYDFNRLRRKLGLILAVRPPTMNYDVLTRDELAALDMEAMNDEDLEKAFRRAVTLEDRGTAEKMAIELTQSSVSDRFFAFNYLIQMAHNDNEMEAILRLLDQAEEADAATNEGRRLNDYALKRGQMLAKAGRVDNAFEAFAKLLTKAPDELKYYGPAIEAMLAQKHAAHASQLAERALAQARSQNNRDMENYFLELASAAKKLQ